MRARWDEALDQTVSAPALADAGLGVRRDPGSKPLREWLQGGHVMLSDLAPWLATDLDPTDPLAQELAEDAVYAPYLARQDAELRDLAASNAVRIAPDFPYASVPGLSNEMIERLSRARPESLSAAGRLPGITPAALAALLVHVRRFEKVPL